MSSPNLTQLIERWACVARICRELAEAESLPERAAALRTAAVNREDCVKDLREALAALQSRPADQTAGDLQSREWATDKRTRARMDPAALDELTRQRAEPERLKELAMVGALEAHARAMHNSHPMSQIAPRPGHVFDAPAADWGFSICPHPDCLLVRGTETSKEKS